MLCHDFLFVKNMTLKGQGCDPEMFGAHYLTGPMTSGDLRVSRSWPRYV